MLVFAHPWLFALLPLPWLLRAVLPPRRSSQTTVRVPFGKRLVEASAPGAGRCVDAARSLVAPTLIWVLALVATARPQWIEPPVTKETPARDLLLLVDLSGSMEQEDFDDGMGKRVDRLTAVKGVLGDFLEKRQGDRVGLVVFGDAPYLQTPFTTDLDLAKRLLDECRVGMAGPRTALGDAIGLGVGLFDKSELPAKTIIALTDGNDTKSQIPPVEAARVAAQRGVRIHTVAIGDPTTVGEDKLDEQALQEVAKAADGSYFFAADRKSLQGIYDELDKIETREIEIESHRPRKDYYYVPLALALALSMLSRLTLALKHGSAATACDAAPRVLVNPGTGKLEVTA